VGGKLAEVEVVLEPDHLPRKGGKLRVYSTLAGLPF
jgi:hypothetical protein